MLTKAFECFARFIYIYIYNQQEKNTHIYVYIDISLHANKHVHLKRKFRLIQLVLITKDEKETKGNKFENNRHFQVEINRLDK